MSTGNTELISQTSTNAGDQLENFVEKRHVKRTQRTYPTPNYSSKYVHRDKARRHAFSLNELERLVLKSIISDLHLPVAVRFTASSSLESLNGARASIKNRCVVSGRARAVNRFFRLSRFAFRSLSSKGQLPGVYHTSW